MKSGNVWEDFEWPVATEYEWRESPIGLVLAIAPGASVARRYRPLGRESASLFQKFADTDPTADSVLQFARQFGTLGAPVRRITEQSWRVDTELLRGSRTAAAGFELMGGEAAMFEPLDDPSESNAIVWSWKAQIELMANFTRWLRERFNRGARQREPLDEAIADLHTYSRLSTVNRILAATSAPRLSAGVKRGSLHFRFEPISLLGALWLQAAQAAGEGVRYRHCATCKRPIAVARTTAARADAKFCSNACRSRHYRQKQARAVALSTKGWSAARIAKQLHADAATVRGWIS